jgi:hypothetical protein
MKLLLALLLFINTAFACDKNVQKLSKDSPSPCAGWLVSEDQMQSFAKQTDQLELNKKSAEVHSQMLKLTEKEMDYYKQKSVSVGKELDKADSRRFWTNLGHFALGVVLTGIAAKAAIESTK